MVDRKSHEMMTEPGDVAPLDGDRAHDVLNSGPPGEPEKAPGDEVVGSPLSAEAGREPEAPANETAVAPPAAASRAPYPSREPPKAAGMGRALLGGVLGGAIVAALAAAAMTQYPPKAELSQDDLGRIAAVETAAGREADAIASLDKRIGALEAASAAGAAKLDAGGRAVQAVSGDIKTLRADVDAARGEIPALSARLDKVEKVATAGPDLSARVQKLETEAAAPKKPSSDNPAAVAILAETIRDKLASGAPFGAELSALAGLGVDPARLAALKAMADGAPTNSALAASFKADEAKIAAAVAPKESDTIEGRFLAHVRSLVQVRPLGEVQGDDPQALSSQVLADLQRGDLAQALAAFAKLPAPAREAASGFAAAAKGKLEAAAAAQAIRDAAVARIADVKP